MYTPNYGPLGYNAWFFRGPDDKSIVLPVVTWNTDGEAMVFNQRGLLVAAATLPGFRYVTPGT